MRSHQILFVVLVALCALAAQEGANAQALRKLFGMVGKAEAEVPAEAEVLDDYDQKSAADAVDVETVDEPADEASEERDTPVSTTPRPGFFHQFSFPTLPPFTFPPFPAIPALPALPVLPPLPQLPPLPNLATIFPSVPPRETIVATQTLLVEVTRRVTRVPICMSVVANRPPCVVNDDTVHGGNSYRADSDSLWNDNIGEEGRIYIQPTAAYHYPQVMPTTTPLEGESRQGKYIVLESARSAEKDVTADLQSSVVQPHGALPAAGAGVGVGVGVAALLGLGLPVTHIVSKTLYVTRVDTVTDYRVTATLVANNCVPNGVNIQYCPAKPPAPYTRYSSPATQRPPTYPTTRRTTYYPTTYPTTRRTTYPTTYPPTYPTTRYTTRRTTPRRTTQKPTTSYPNHPYGAPDGAYPPYSPESPALYEPAYTPSPYKGGEIDEQVDVAEGVDEVLDNLAKA